MDEEDAILLRNLKAFKLPQKINPLLPASALTPKNTVNTFAQTEQNPEGKSTAANKALAPSENSSQESLVQHVQNLEMLRR